MLCASHARHPPFFLFLLNSLFPPHFPSHYIFHSPSYRSFFPLISAYFHPSVLPANVFLSPTFSCSFSFTPTSFLPYLFGPLIVFLVTFSPTSPSSPATSRFSRPMWRSWPSDLGRSGRSWRRRGRLREKPLSDSHRSVWSTATELVNKKMLILMLVIPFLITAKNNTCKLKVSVR